MRQGRKGENAIGVEAERRSKERELIVLGLQHCSPCGWVIFYRDSSKAEVPRAQ